MISGRGRKIHIKRQSDNETDFDSESSNDEYFNSKHRRRSSKDYQITLNELHTASEKFIQSNEKKNQNFNYDKMTNLSNDNLNINNLRDCLIENDEDNFLNSINSYLEQFRQRLIKYFIYMKSDIYRQHLRKQLDNEIELNKALKLKVNCLENNIKILLEDAINLLKMRTNELGIEELERPEQLISYANDISNKHKELRSKVATLEKEIAEYNYENDKINFVLNNIRMNGHQIISINKSEQTMNDNIYSTLLVNMSKQTQQQETKQQSNHIEYLNRLPIKPNQISSLSMNSNKAERKTDFIIQKRSRKVPNLNTDNSTIKAIKVNETNPDKTGSSLAIPVLLPWNIPTNINSLLSTKKIEPVQVHSVVSKVEQHKPMVESKCVQTSMDNSLSALNKLDDNRSV